MGADNYVTKEQLSKKYQAFKAEWDLWVYKKATDDFSHWYALRRKPLDGSRFGIIESFNDYQHGLGEFDKMRGAASIAATLNVY